MQDNIPVLILNKLFFYFQFDIASLYTFDDATGTWTNPILLATLDQSAGRRKRQANGGTVGVIGNPDDPPFWLIASPLAGSDFCSISIVVWDSDGTTVLPGVGVTVTSSTFKTDYTTNSNGHVRLAY